MSRKTPLEWKTDTISTTDATVTPGEFDLDLLPNELAEIFVIKSTINITMSSAVIHDADANMYLSMDPDADDDPSVIKNMEDLEVFFHHFFNLDRDYAEATETGGAAIRNSGSEILTLPEHAPILLGTNFSQVVVGDSIGASNFITTVYFKRRKASKEELFNILLKRR